VVFLDFSGNTFALRIISEEKKKKTYPSWVEPRGPTHIHRPSRQPSKAHRGPGREQQGCCALLPHRLGMHAVHAKATPRAPIKGEHPGRPCALAPASTSRRRAAPSPAELLEPRATAGVRRPIRRDGAPSGEDDTALSSARSRAAPILLILNTEEHRSATAIAKSGRLRTSPTATSSSYSCRCRRIPSRVSNSMRPPPSPLPDLCLTESQVARISGDLAGQAAVRLKLEEEEDPAVLQLGPYQINR
jgi:hypothetical protein